MDGMFYGSIFNQPIGNWDVSKVTNMRGMFFRSIFNQPIGNWDVSKVTNMREMFTGSEFNQPIGNWDVSKVTNMSGMFTESKFNQPIGNWDVSNVTNMDVMFSYTLAFNQPIGNWDVSNVTNMSRMFSYTLAFNQPIGNWNVSKVKDMYSMFSNAKSFNQPIENWNVISVSDMNGMFWSSSFNQSINQWCVINIKTEPHEFSTGSPLTNQNKPVWGTCQGLPLKTNLTKPSNNVLGSTFKPTFEWETIKDATKYQVQIIEGFDPVVVDTIISTISLSVVKSLKSKTLHNWRVRGYNESKKLFGEWSDVWKFTTKEIPTPSLSLPTNGSLELSGPIELVWSTTQDATSYHVQVSGVNSFSPIFFENTNVTSNSVKLPNLVGGNPVIFFWRVRSKLDSGETGAWSNVWSFTRSKLTSDGDTKELPIQYSLDQNFPNPFNPTTNISFSLPSTVHTRLEVLNVLGQPVSVLVNQTMGSGTHTVSFDGSSLSSGIYLYRLTTPEFTQTRVMSLVK
jgi:surface protein